MNYDAKTKQKPEHNVEYKSQNKRKYFLSFSILSFTLTHFYLQPICRLLNIVNILIS